VHADRAEAQMADRPPPVDLEDQDEPVPTIRESSRGGNEPPARMNDRPEQNAGYDEAVKGRPLTEEERRRAERESPLAKPDDPLVET
jgi:hypothetical protein